MYKYLVLFVLVTPLTGIWMVEQGELALSIGVDGYPNGATGAYALYAAATALVALLVARSRRRGRVRTSRPGVSEDARFKQFATLLLVTSSSFLLLFLFGFGAYEVWTGAMGKGAFRVSLGFWGAFPNMMSKVTLPILLAYAALLYIRSSRRRTMRWLLAVNMMLVFVIGASWGFKAGALWPLLPALLLLNWDIRIRGLLKLSGFFVATLLFSFWVFDSRIEGRAPVVDSLVNRITVYQGDVAWYIWDLHQKGEEFPPYWPVFLAAAGDKVLSAWGLDKADHDRWMLFHYDWMLTYFTGVPLDRIAGGQSVTGTPFSEGLIAGGKVGLAFITLFAGVSIGLMYRLLDGAIRHGHAMRASIGASYFCNNLLSWLNGGAVVQLFHIAVLLGIAFSATLVLVMRSRYRI